MIMLLCTYPSQSFSLESGLQIYQPKTRIHHFPGFTLVARITSQALRLAASTQADDSRSMLQISKRRQPETGARTGARMLGWGIIQHKSRQPPPGLIPPQAS